MTRRCSHCSHNGHNSRTCTSRGGGSSGGVKLFGVRLTDGSIIKKSASMGNLSSLYHSSSSSAASPNPSSPAAADAVDGYLSDDPAHASCSAKRRADRKKGTPWTEEEHRLFLIGLQKLGKGDWRGIARNFVLSRTPTQVASHAQKYFIRQCGSTRRKRRSSLFDMAPDTGSEQQLPPEDHFMLPPQAVAMDSDPSMEATTSKMIENIKEEASTNVSDLPPLTPAFYPAYVPMLFPLWPSNATPLEQNNNINNNNNNNDNNNNNNNNNINKVLKPIPVLPKEPMNVEELVGMSSQLTLNETDQRHMEPSALSLKLHADPSRQSAFHASMPPVSGSGVNKGEGNIVQAI